MLNLKIKMLDLKIKFATFKIWNSDSLKVNILVSFGESLKINGFQELEKMSSARSDPENGIKTTKIKIEKFPEDQNISNTMMRMTKTSRDEKIDSFEEKPGQIPKNSNVKEMLSSDDSMIGIEDIPQDLIFYA